MLDAVTFYASFDRAVRADVGVSRVRTRSGRPTEPEQWTFQDGYDASLYRIADGVSGGALEALAAPEDFGRFFFPGEGNLPYASGGWQGSASFWINTDPNTRILAPFCDPIQITQKGANCGGLWIDFPESSPRDMRLGAFPGVGRIFAESDPDAPLVVVRDVGFRWGDWHHVAFTWTDFDTGRADARAALYVDGQLQGELAERDIAMGWDLAQTGIYVAVNYVGLLDELALFRRALTATEIRVLSERPDALSSLQMQ
ncbi:MAG: LamG-like jellyroll fold domain-containing protein [Bryobacterales bacterium]